MAASARTAQSAQFLAAQFPNGFTAAQYAAYTSAYSGLVTLATLQRHNLVHVINNVRTVDRAWTPADFAEYVTYNMVGEDCYGMNAHFEFNANNGMIEDVTYTCVYAVA